ncbi:HtaA domain-containing protein [Rhodococcus koreensis]
MRPVALLWGVKDSFVAYIARFGEISIKAPAMRVGDRFRFPLVEHDDQLSQFSGSVVFTAHGSALNVEITDPWIHSAPTPHLTVAGTVATRTAGQRLRLAELSSSVASEPDQTVDTELASAGAVVFDFQYRSSEKLDPLGFEWANGETDRRS